MVVIMMRVVTVKLPKDLLELLDRISIKKNVPRSVLIRQAIEKMLKEEGLLEKEGSDEK
jgi:metal-responsive CopG/Arc/MetJ family transcriptional regulator